jgi:hypothetical protein
VPGAPPLQHNPSPRRRLLAAAPAAALAAAALICAPARAQLPAAPLAHPSRDVDVTYRMERGDRVLTERMRWQAATLRQRVDPPTEGLFIVIDYKAGRMRTVRLSDRLVLEMAAPPSGGGAYVRQGADQVAGLPCTDWQATATDGRSTVACITDDGVMLRASAGGRTLVSAASVDYAPQDPALFAVPDGFIVRRVEDAP